VGAQVTCSTFGVLAWEENRLNSRHPENEPTGPVSSDGLGELKCPRCGCVMCHGYVVGRLGRLRWAEREKTYTVFAGQPLRRTFSWWSAPTVEAMRCEVCKMGVFRYDY